MHKKNELDLDESIWTKCRVKSPTMKNDRSVIKNTRPNDGLTLSDICNLVTTFVDRKDSFKLNNQNDW